MNGYQTAGYRFVRVGCVTIAGDPKIIENIFI